MQPDRIKVGIDTLAIYTPRYALEHATLAHARGIEAEKFHAGLGQYLMSCPPPGEDIVTMAANAAKQVLQGMDVSQIEMLLLATESGIDQSKAAGIYVHGLLQLPEHCRVVELKQACYSGTAAMQMSLSFLRDYPDKKVLVIATDVARYGLNTTAESSQGAGAIAMVLSANPRVLAIEPQFGVITENVMDFWRPNYAHNAFVDGKYSSKLYLTMLEKSFLHYQERSQRHFADHDYFCYHTPVPRLVEKAHQYLAKINQQEANMHLVADSIEYTRKMGNSYSASLYVALASLLDHANEDLTHKRIGFYSYGSGCVAEYFSGVVQVNYKQALHTAYHQELFSSRKLLSYDEYAAFFEFQYAEDGSQQEIPAYQTGAFRLTKMQEHKRIYECVQEVVAPAILIDKKKDLRDVSIIRINAPGKLILSGEHAVVHGQPALAMAINRYVTATVSRETVPQVLFDLSDLSHHSRLTYDALRHFKEKIKQKYYRFIRGDYSIRDVLQKPFELAQFAMSVMAESLNVALADGVKIKVQSDLPMGCGMGSSAATIVSVMQAISNCMQLNLSSDAIYKLALEAENMQHGQSSGLDLRVALQGGCMYVHDQQITPRQIPAMPMYLVNTGTPLTTTGQCVEKVAPLFQSALIKNEFAAITQAMDAALQSQSWSGMRAAIQQNHKLLVQIGVVPERVQAFISQVDATGGAAKICGAGAIAGDHAGAVWVVTEDKSALDSLAKRFGYNVIPITGESRGVHAA